MRSVLLRAAAIVGAGAALGIVSHLVQFASPIARSNVPEVCDEPDSILASEVAPADAAQLCDNRDVVVIDVRPAADFERGHVAGAVHLPCSAGVLERPLAGQLSEAAMILVYGKNTDEARPVAASLLQRRLGEVRIIEGGYAAWENHGFACTSGPCEHCEENEKREKKL